MDDQKLLTIFYHDIFEYPLTANELEKWKIGGKFLVTSRQFPVAQKGGYYFLKGRGELIKMRQEREKIAKKKTQIASKAAGILKIIPSVRLVGVTGALAMGNTKAESDIDLMIVTSVDTLWLTRLVAYAILGLAGFKIRRAGETNEKDKLCLNMWLDENNLIWSVKDRNMYSAHEFGQLVPLVNKNQTYEHLMHKNRWVKDYWPNIKV